MQKFSCTVKVPKKDIENQHALHSELATFIMKKLHEFEVFVCTEHKLHIHNVQGEIEEVTENKLKSMMRKYCQNETCYTEKSFQRCWRYVLKASIEVNEKRFLESQKHD
jgi:hypothetical protein